MDATHYIKDIKARYRVIDERRSEGIPNTQPNDYLNKELLAGTLAYLASKGHFQFGGHELGDPPEYIFFLDFGGQRSKCGIDSKGGFAQTPPRCWNS